MNLDNLNGYFTYISHKLLTRTMAISGYAQGLEYGVISPEKAGSFIQKESAALSEDIRRLMSLAALDNKKAVEVPTSVPVIELLENCTDCFYASAKQKGIIFSIQKSAKEIYITGYEDYLEEILDNLFSNAVRYAKREIFLSVQTADDKVIVTVADDGDGISEKDMPHIFERFYKGKNGYFGLGLPIARSAAERMGGTLTAENGENGGAVFTLTLKAG